jgi:hypothetical protein
VRLDLGSLRVAPGSILDSVLSFSAAVSRVDLGPLYSHPPFAGGCVFNPVIESPSAELLVSEVPVSRELENLVVSWIDFPPA